MPESGFLQFQRLLDEMNQTDSPSTRLINDYKFFTDLVQNATHCEPGSWYSIDILSCQRSRLDGQPCEVQTRLSEKPDKIRWECKKCRLSGVITQFEESLFDSRHITGDNGIYSRPDMETMMNETVLVEIHMPEKTYSILKEVLGTGQHDRTSELDKIAEFQKNEVNLTLPVPLAMMMLHSLEMYQNEIGKHKSTVEKLIYLFEQESMKAHIGVIAGYLRGEYTVTKASRMLGFQDQQAMDELEDLRFTLEESADEENISFSEMVDQYVADQINAIPDSFQKDIGGLSSMQITYMGSQDDWMHAIGGIRVNYAALDPDTVRSIPFMMNVQILYKHLLDSGGKLPLGRDGRFLPKTVLYMIENGVWPEYSLEWIYKQQNTSGSVKSTVKSASRSSDDGSPAGKTSRRVRVVKGPVAGEPGDLPVPEKYQFIEELAGVLVHSGLFTIKKGKYIPVRGNADLMMTRNSPKLYALLLQTLYLEYDMAYRFSNELAELIAYAQDNITYTLFQLHRMKGKSMMSARKLTSLLLHPDLLDGVLYAETPDLPDVQRIILEYICFSIYLEPLSRFGLVELNAGDPTHHSFTFKARKTPLFDLLITFEL